MKKTWNVGAMGMVLILFLAGCGKAEQKEQKREVRIGVSLYRGDDTFINNIRTELERCARNYEQEHNIKIVLDIQDAKGSQNIQNNQVERFISLGCDVLCINPVDRTRASVIIDKAMMEEIPVIFFNRQPVEEDMERWNQLYYVGTAARESAELQGSILVDQYEKDPSSLDKNGDGVVSYVLLEGESSHQDALIRTEWSVQTLKDGEVPIEKITGGIANWNRDQASALMEKWLEQYPDIIELVICNNDDMALGALDAMSRSSIEGISLVGIDGTIPGLENVRSGKLLGTVSADKEEYAKAIFSIAVAKALGQEIEGSLELEDEQYYWASQKIVTNEE